MTTDNPSSSTAGNDLTSLEERLRAAAAAEGQQVNLDALDDSTITRLMSGLEETPKANPISQRPAPKAPRPGTGRDPLTAGFADMFENGLPGEFFEIRIPPIISAYRRGGEQAVQDHVRSLGMPDDVVAQVLADLPMLLEQVDIPEK